MILLELFYRFFQIGLFSVGGGLATIPFLYRLAEQTHWFDQSLIASMLAISESTPGPIGVNMATFVGYHVHGVLGGVVASLGLVSPSVLIIILLAKVYEKIAKYPVVQDGFYGLRAASFGLIAGAFVLISKEAYVVNSQLNFFYLAMGILLFVLLQKTKMHPIVMIILSAMLGIIGGYL